MRNTEKRGKSKLSEQRMVYLCIDIVLIETMPAHTQVSGSHLHNHTKTVTIITPHVHARAGSYCNGDSAELEFARGGLF